MSGVGNGLRPAAREDLRALAVDVAPRLLGGVLVTDVAEERVVVRITEVEAYLGLGTGDVPDPGSHARMGPTARNATMWGEPGHLYVYLSHGIHSCVNVVAAPAGGAGGILLRAGEIVPLRASNACAETAQPSSWMTSTHAPFGWKATWRGVAASRLASACGRE